MSVRIESPSGGAAFPLPTECALEHAGMSLRDYFAAQALAGYRASGGFGEEPAVMAQWAYADADAMLKARKVTR